MMNVNGVLGAVCGLALLVAGAAEARECRSPRTKIVGGQDATLGDWPGQAAIRLNRAGGVGYFCGGAAIAKRWILTAAHCLGRGVEDQVDAGARLEAVLGVADLRKATAEHLYPVADWVVFPGYQDAVLKGDDIALLKLERDYEGPIMPLSLSSRTDPDLGQLLRVAGFGRTRTPSGPGDRAENFIDGQSGRWATGGWPRLLEATVSTADSAACLSVNRYRATANGPLITPAIGAGQLCAAPDVAKEARRGSCQGDSGGPLVAYKDGCPIQVGLVSWAYQCGRSDYPTVFTRISAYRDWIEATIGETPQTVSAIDPVEVFSKANRDAMTQQLGALLGATEGRLTLSLPGEKTTFRLGDQVAITVTSRVSGALILLDLDAGGKLTQIFPNEQMTTKGRVLAGQPLLIPNVEEYGEAYFQAVEPVGDSMLIALVTPDAASLSAPVAQEFSATKGFQPRRRPTAVIKDLVAEIQAQIDGDPSGWAFATLRYEITR